MGARRLKTVVLGVSGAAQGRAAGSFLAETAAATGMFEIAAVADKDLETAQKVAKEYGAQAYDDYRLALVHKELEVVLSGSGLASAIEHFRAAAARKLHVFRLGPAARNFDELGGLVKLASESGIHFGVGSGMRQMQAFNALSEKIKASGPDGMFIVTALCPLSEFQDTTQRDPKIAGGGVLLHSGYGMLDQIVSMFGVPSQVHCWLTSEAPDRQQRLYVTEDTAVVNMKYSDTLLANVIVSKSFKAGSESLNIYCRDKNMKLTPSYLVIENGAEIEANGYEDCEGDAIKKLLINFAQVINGEPDIKAVSPVESHLDVMAVIDTAYLSARTGMPENPEKITQISNSRANRIVNSPKL